MTIDEEKGFANIDERDFAAPTRQGTFAGNDQNYTSPHFPPSRVGTGIASISQPGSAPGTRPTSFVGSLRSNATGPANGKTDQNHVVPQYGTRPNSLDEAGPQVGTCPNSLDEAASMTGPFKPEDIAGVPLDAEGKIREEQLGAWLVGQFRNDLFSIQRDGREGRDHRPHLTASIAGLNRMRMRKLQVKLVHSIVHMRYNGTEPEGWEDLLKEYIEASKDSDYIRQCHGRNFDDPFLVRSDRYIDAHVFKSELDMIPPEKRKPDGLHELSEKDGHVTSFALPREKHPEPIGGTRGERTEKQKTEDFLQRLGFAVIGGVFLVAPMWLMVLHNTLYTALVTTTVAVLLCGVLTAWWLQGDDALNMVLSVTAAYAAVLVVFVGTSHPS